MFLRATLPEHHLSADTKDVVKLGMALISTMTALVLALLIASAKDLYDTQNKELIEMSAKISLLDRVLATYGPESKEARELLRAGVARGLGQIWPQDGSAPSQLDPTATRGEGLYARIQELSPQTDSQRALREQALTLTMGLGYARWLMFAQGSSSISMPLLIGLVFWLTTIFSSLGLLAPRNGTVVATIFVCALSVSGAIFLMLEMYSPFDGLIQISSAPCNTLAHLGQ
jgi:hypothetical protein